MRPTLAVAVAAELPAPAHALEATEASLADNGDQGHVDSWGDDCSGEKGDGHIDFKECVLAVDAEAFVCCADLLAGDSGAAICETEYGNGHVDFRIGIDPDGCVRANGQLLAVCDPDAGCRLELAWSGSANTLVVQVVAADGTHAEGKYCLEEAPAQLRVEAAEIRHLSLTEGDGHVEFKQGSTGWVWAIDAEAVAGASGAVVCATEHDNDHIDFRIGIDPDGSVCVNGEELAVCDPADCHLSLAWSGSTNTLVVEVTAADGTLAAGQYYLEQAPAELRVEAAEIRYLSLTAQ